jgi:hypothetical protein
MAKTKDDAKPEKKKVRKPSDLEEQLKTDLFKRMVLGEGRSSGKRENKHESKDPWAEQRKFMRDPFGTEDWAKSKRIPRPSERKESKPADKNVVTFDLLGLTPDEVAKAQEDGKFGGWSFVDPEPEAKAVEKV